MKGHRIGYIRVSTVDQNTDRQLEGIELDRVFTDKASGKDVKRPQLEAMLSFVREGDIIIVHSLDRLARNLDDLRKIVKDLTGRGVKIEFKKENPGIPPFLSHHFEREQFMTDFGGKEALRSEAIYF